MALCIDPTASIVAGSGMYITGSGTPGDPWVLSVTDPVDIVDLENDIANIQATLLTLASTYVNVTGDTMTGPLTSISSGTALRARRSVSERPYIEFYSTDGTKAYAVIVGADSALELIAYGDATDGIIRFMPNNVTKGVFDGTEMMIGKTLSGINTQGIELHHTAASALWVTRVVSTGANIISNKNGAANADGQTHILFESAGTGIGAINRATSSTVSYGTSSDRDLKENIVPVDDELALLWMRTVEPSFFNFKIDPDVTHVGYIAQDLAEAWPASVTNGIVSPGHGNVEDRTWDEDGNETTDPEVWQGWQIDYSKFTPFLHSSVQALDRLTMAQQATIDAQAVQIADLEARLAAVEAIIKPK